MLCQPFDSNKRQLLARDLQVAVWIINLQVNGFQIHLHASCPCSCDDQKDLFANITMYVSTLRRIPQQIIQEGTCLEESNGFWPLEILSGSDQPHGQSESSFCADFCTQLDFVSANSGWQRWGWSACGNWRQRNFMSRLTWFTTLLVGGFNPVWKVLISPIGSSPR